MKTRYEVWLHSSGERFVVEVDDGLEIQAIAGPIDYRDALNDDEMESYILNAPEMGKADVEWARSQVWSGRGI